MIDTHAHIYSEYYDDIDNLIEELKSNNILYVLNASTCYKDALEVINLSKKYDNYLLPVIGIHPEEIENIDLDKIEELIKNNTIVKKIKKNKKNYLLIKLNLLINIIYLLLYIQENLFKTVLIY